MVLKFSLNINYEIVCHLTWSDPIQWDKWLTDLITHSLTHPLTHSSIHPLTHTLAHWFTLSNSHSRAHSHAHILTLSRRAPHCFFPPVQLDEHYTRMASEQMHLIHTITWFLVRHSLWALTMANTLTTITAVQCKISKEQGTWNKQPLCKWWILLPIWSGGRLNKKDGLTRYGNSHVKDKTSLRPSYL